MENLVNYVKTPISPVFNIKAIYTIHYFKYGQKFQFKGEQHNFWEMVYIDAGSAMITADNKTFALKQGEAVFHQPNEYHAITTEDKFANSVIISFECNSRAMNLFKQQKFILNNEEKQLLNKIVTESSLSFQDKLNNVYLNKMTKRTTQPFGSEHLIKIYIEQLFISLVRNNIDSTNKTIIDVPHKKNTANLVDRIKDILQNSIYTGITLDQLSNELYFSKTYLKSIFKKATGSSIISYFLILKIDEAKKLISTNEYTFTEIAYKLNFNSIHYFSRQFKQITEMTPSEYARSIKVDNIL